MSKPTTNAFYSTDTKVMVGALVRSGMPIAEIAKRTGIPDSTVDHWAERQDQLNLALPPNSRELLARERLIAVRELYDQALLRMQATLPEATCRDATDAIRVLGQEERQLCEILQARPSGHGKALTSDVLTEAAAADVVAIALQHDCVLTLPAARAIVDALVATQVLEGDTHTPAPAPTS